MLLASFRLMRTIALRLQALLLLLTLVGGGFGLPLYDAVVYHSALEHAQPRSNSVASESATSTHGVTCAMDLASRCGTGLTAFPDLGLLPGPSVRTTILRPLPVAPTQTWLASTHSRAPPRSLS
jgi:hypothetical protein